jgi:hypothetical protein
MELMTRVPRRSSPRLLLKRKSRYRPIVLKKSYSNIEVLRLARQFTV